MVDRMPRQPEPLHIQPRMTVFAGPNGSGKSTLTRVIAPRLKLDRLINADVLGAQLASEQGLPQPDARMQLAAARAAELSRWDCLERRVGFATETVMSDAQRWLAFFASAKQRRFRFELYFVTTNDPAINVARVRQRVLLGGHPVPEDKIVARYHKAMAVLPEVLKLVDAGLLFDNSAERFVRQLQVVDGMLQPALPERDLTSWARALLGAT